MLKSIKFSHSIIASLLLPLYSSMAMSEFSFNFKPLLKEADLGFLGGNTDYEIQEVGSACGRYGNLHCDVDTIGGVIPEGRFKATATDWLQEAVYIGGIAYWHNIVGHPDEGFVLEYFTRMGNVNPDFVRRKPLFVGDANEGMPEAVFVGDGASFIASEILGRNITREGKGCWAVIGPACNPLGHNIYLQSNGYQNPSTVAMKQIVNNSEFELVFEKNTLMAKPKITQSIRTKEVAMDFKADMSSGNYNSFGQPLVSSSDINADNVFVNTLQILENAALISKFDYAKDASEQGSVTAGRVIYTAGMGWADNRPNIRFRDVVSDFAEWEIGNGRIYDKGFYTYADDSDSFDLDKVDWSSYMDPDQNPCGGGPWCDMKTPYHMPQ